ncbi:LysR family transcriptional regulator [Ursidibacter sp. B-7004-1]
MTQENLNDLRAFVVVARTGSFTKAGLQLGISQSALSHCIRALEKRLNIKLFYRTTRSVSTTEAGEQLYQRLSPLFEHIYQELDSLNAFRSSLKGTLRINGNEHVFRYVLPPKFLKFTQTYPDVQLELAIENRFVDIVAERFDAGIRLGSDIAKDMIAVRISPDLTMCAVASPSYLERYGTPKTPYDLTEHRCLLHRLSSGGVMNWEFIDPLNKRVIKVQPQGSFASNGGFLQHDYAVNGIGILWTPEDTVINELQSGQLIRLLPDWEISYEGYHLYYPNRHHSPLLRALIEMIRE